MNLANILRIDADCVNVKAKTNEKLGFEGQELGVVAQAVVLLEKLKTSHFSGFSARFIRLVATSGILT